MSNTFMPHNWVEIQITPISVEPTPEGVVTYTSPEALEISSEEQVNLCWSCRVDLNPDSFDTACEAGPTPETLANAG